MNESKALESLIFCNICYYPETKTKSSTLLISYCMHVVCNDCIQDMEHCAVCDSKTVFVSITRSINSKLNKNPSELFCRPIDIIMFQVNNSVNLIEYLREQIRNLKKILILAKAEIETLRNTKNKVTSTKSNNVPIYKKTCSKNSLNKEKIKKVRDIIESAKKDSEKSTSILDFSNSSFKAGKITIPKDFNPYKNFYKK